MKKQTFICTVLTLSMAAACLPGTPAAAADNGAIRNTSFTTMAQMRTALGSSSTVSWSPVYLTEPESDYWTFADQDRPDPTDISINIAKNAYRSLEMLLDDGCTMDYDTLSDYCAD